MKKLKIFSFFLMYASLFCFEITTVNPEPDIIENEGFTVISVKNSYYLQTEGDPAVPVKTIFFEIPIDKEISKVNCTEKKLNDVFLELPLMPIQKNVPLSNKEPMPFIFTDQMSYRNGSFPENLIYNSGSEFCGNTNIGFISYYCGIYTFSGNLFSYYEEITFDIELTDNTNRNFFPSSFATEQVLNSLHIPGRYDNTEIRYLLITPEIFLDEYQVLLDFRRIQGVETFFQTVEYIEQNFPGIDLEEKIRNYIISQYEEQAISYVTLGADTDQIPSRTVFAFDCGCGSQADENDIRADMYYSCLNGNWNADGDEIYGEEADDVDFLPEVFVGRIAANSEIDVADYISRLISYEKGILENYANAAGFSMELWSGSNSEVCQQYIYEQYFPDLYDITLLYDDENTMENAYALLNQNINIVQHTGHASKTSLSLESGHIKTSNLENLQNDYGGLFYSIGCWSAALDYNSIGEALVMSEDKGHLAYVGNSRYGWGAPAASSFGFSEFFQKEFFKQVFWYDNTIISTANALQKLPFIAFFGGTSVYKWVAYELNEVGDSYFNLINEDPRELEYNIEVSQDLQLYITENGLPVENVIITSGDNQTRSNASGEAALEKNSNILFLYKYGFKFAEIDLTEYQSLPYIGDITGNSEVLQGQSFQISSTLHNPTNQNFSFSVEYEYDESKLDIYNMPYTANIQAYSSLDLLALNGNVHSIEVSGQMECGEEIIVTQKIYDSGNELITKKSIILTILAPEFILRIRERPDVIIPGSSTSFCYEFVNTSSLTLDYLNINFIPGNEYFEFENTKARFNYPTPSGQNRSLENWIINISEEAPDDFVGSYTIKIETGINYNNSVYTFQEEIMLPLGTLAWEDDFENGLNWSCSEEWQLVDNFAASGSFSLSCRPDETGNYTAAAPSFVYSSDLELAFKYKYKMPMYGNDGVFFILEYDSSADTLIFLGAGGALPQNSGSQRTIEIYIEDDWVEYRLNLDEVLLNVPEVGTLMTFKLIFNYAAEIIGFNQYGIMNDIGVFIDDLSVREIDTENENDEPDFESGILHTYPNPIHTSDVLNIAFSAADPAEVSLGIYNIKGQLVKKIQRENNLGGLICWDLKDDYKRPVTSGIYLIRWKAGNTTKTKKIVLVR